MDMFPIEVVWGLVILAVLLIGFTIYQTVPQTRSKGKRRRRSYRDDMLAAGQASVALAAANQKASPVAGRDFVCNNNILSDARRTFLAALAQVVPPQSWIFVDTLLRSVVSARNEQSRRPIVQQQLNHLCIEYVVCDDSARPLLAIELDDAATKCARQIERNVFLAAALVSAALPLLRIATADEYDIEELRAQITAALSHKTGANAA